jgi:hypothetical protein
MMMSERRVAMIHLGGMVYGVGAAQSTSAAGCWQLNG